MTNRAKTTPSSTPGSFAPDVKAEPVLELPSVQDQGDHWDMNVTSEQVDAAFVKVSDAWLAYQDAVESHGRLALTFEVLRLAETHPTLRYATLVTWDDDLNGDGSFDVAVEELFDAEGDLIGNREGGSSASMFTLDGLDSLVKEVRLPGEDWPRSVIDVEAARAYAAARGELS